MVLIGGYYTTGGQTKSVIQLQGDKWRDLSSLSKERYYHACEYQPKNKEIVVVGGSVSFFCDIQQQVDTHSYFEGGLEDQ